MKIYALAIGARKECDNFTKAFARSSATKNARNEQEAIGIGIQIAMEIFPQSEGYQAHFAQVCEIPQEWIREASKNGLP